MSRWRFEPWRRNRHALVGVDAQRAAWLPASDAALHPVPREGGHLALVSELTLLRPKCIDLVAAPGWAVHWMQTAPAGLAHLGELEQVALARCAHLFGGEPRDWRCAGDWRLDRAFACAALPRAQASAIEQPLRALGANVRWHTAWGLLTARAARLFSGDGWNATRSPSHLQVWACRSGQVHHVATRALSPQDTTEAVVAQALQHARIECAAWGESPPASLRWLDLCSPFGAAPEGTQAVTLSPKPCSWPPTSEARAALALGLQLQDRVRRTRAPASSTT